MTKSMSNKFLSLFHVPWEVNDKNKFDFLDGYRGMLAIIVTITHSMLHEKCEIVNYIASISRPVAIDGFFILSSFLLTNRLLTELSSPSLKPKNQLLIVLKYFIRRFFRIYVVFFLFATIVKYGPKFVGGFMNYSEGFYYSSWSDLVTLQTSGMNHLWTIAPEVKYYFIIPVICLIANKFGRFKFIFFIIGLTWAINNERNNFFSLVISDFDIPNSYLLKTRFSVFFYGSLAAIAFNIVDNNPSISCFVKHKISQTIISILSLALVFYGLRFKNKFFDPTFHSSINFENVSARIWSMVIFLMTIGHPNFLTRQFSRSILLKSSGKYSFGMYLLHSIAIMIQYYPTFQMQTLTEFIIIVVILSYLLGYLFYCLVENNLMKVAAIACERLESLNYFRKDEINKCESEKVLLV